MNKPLSQFKLALALTCLLGNASVQAKDILLKGTATKQNFGTSPKNGEKAVTMPSSALIEQYGEAARSPKVEAAIKSVNSLTREQQARKEASDRFEAQMHGRWLPGSNPTMSIMSGYVPPNMTPEQAAMVSQMLPKMPRMPHQQPPALMSREPFTPMSGFPSPSPGTYAPASIAAENQRLIEGNMRERMGPGFQMPLQGMHHRNTQKVTDKQMSLIPSQFVVDPANRGGSIREVTDSSGNIVRQYSYDPWGTRTILQGSGPDSDFGFRGMYFHERSGLYLTPGRPYSSTLGRWLSRDPFDDSYTYSFNDPINLYDPEGFWPKGLPGRGKAEKKLPAYLKKRVPCLTDEAAKALSDAIIDKLDWGDLKKAGKAANVDVMKDAALGTKYVMPFVGKDEKTQIKQTLMQDIPNMNHLTPDQLQVLKDFMGKLPETVQPSARQVLDSFSPKP